MNECEIKHPGKSGSAYYYEVKTCRGQGCLDAKAAKKRRNTANRAARKLAGPVAAPKPMPPHGTLGRYQNYDRCRCDECRAANSARGRAYAARKAPKKTKVQIDAKELKASAKELRIHVTETPLGDGTYEHTPVLDCGEALGNERYCRRLAPCAIHDHSPLAFVAG